MRISIIVACARNNVIGRQGELPWRLSNDLKNFKRITMGHPILMGRKTFESIGRLLPGRTTIILSRTSDYHFPGAMVVNSWERALEIAAQVDTNPTKECFVIGGGDIYAIALPHASRIYYSQVEADIDGDTFFPSLNESEWTTIDRVDYQADAANEFAFSLRTLQRTSADASDHGSVPP